MIVAIWIIAMAEIIRLVQNTIQLIHIKKESNTRNFDRATDAFIQSLNRTDKDFVEGLLKELKEQRAD